MKTSKFDIQRLASLLIVITLLVYILIVGKSTIVPLAFATLFSFMLLPICRFIETKIPYRMTAIGLSFLVTIIPVLLILLVFSWLSMDVYQDLPSIWEKLQDGFGAAFNWLNEQLHFTRLSGEEWMQANSKSLLEGPLSYLGSGVTSSSTFFVNIGLVFIYTFLLLLYRTSFKKFFLMQVSDDSESNAQQLLRSIQQLTQQYLYGLLIVMFILGILNSLGLWLIGISYPAFWGFLAAFLAIIPFVGTFLGGLMTVTYAVATTTSIWQPVAVIGLFAFVQFLEGNVITPKIVGESVKVNPLAIILSLVIGGSIWGVAGLILAVPVIATLKKIMEQVDVMKPFSLLLSSELYQKDELFEGKFNEERFRLRHLFKKKKP